MFCVLGIDRFSIVALLMASTRNIIALLLFWVLYDPSYTSFIFNASILGVLAGSAMFDSSCTFRAHLVSSLVVVNTGYVTTTAIAQVL